MAKSKPKAPGTRTPLTKAQKAFAERLKSFMQEHQITQSELARRLGVQPSAVNHWLQGNTVPNGRLLSLIPRAVGANARWLLGGVNTSTVRPELKVATLDGQREALMRLRTRINALFMEMDAEISAALYDDGPTPGEG